MRGTRVIIGFFVVAMTLFARVPQIAPVEHQIILDASNTCDWVRVNNWSWYKYKDSALLPNSLLKFDINDIPDGITILNATLHYFVESNVWPYTPIGIGYCIDNSWSSDSTTPFALYNWMVDVAIDTDTVSMPGWREFDVTEALIIQQYVGEPFFSLKLHNYPATARLASPGSANADLQPYVWVHYSGTAALADLVTYPTWINVDVEPLVGDTNLIVFNAKARNNGSTIAQNVGVQFYVDNTPCGSVQVIPQIYPGASAEVLLERVTNRPISDMEVTAEIDPLNSIQEYDEQNNIALLVFQVPESLYVESFESDFGDWEADYDVPRNYETGGPKETSFTRVSGQAKDGIYSVQMGIDGTGDDGTVWLKKAIPVFPNRTYQVKLSFWHYREHDPQYITTSYHIVGYVGNYVPETESDFEILDGLDDNIPHQGQGNQYPRWESYTVTKNISTGSGQYVWAAFGFTAVYECWISKLLDYATVEVEEIE